MKEGGSNLQKIHGKNSLYWETVGINIRTYLPRIWPRSVFLFKVYFSIFLALNQSTVAHTWFIKSSPVKSTLSQIYYCGLVRPSLMFLGLRIWSSPYNGYFGWNSSNFILIQILELKCNTYNLLTKLCVKWHRGKLYI